MDKHIGHTFGLENLPAYNDQNEFVKVSGNWTVIDYEPEDARAGTSAYYVLVPYGTTIDDAGWENLVVICAPQDFIVQADPRRAARERSAHDALVAAEVQARENCRPLGNVRLVPQ
jgi:hypothetical protein